MKEDNKPESDRGRAISTRIGFLLWRGGLAFCAAYIAVRSLSRIISLALEIGIPPQLVWGLAFMSIGFLLLMFSLIVERIIDARAERGLGDQ